MRSIGGMGAMAPPQVMRLDQSQQDGLKHAIRAVLSSPNSQAVLTALAEVGAINANAPPAGRAGLLLDVSSNPWVRMTLCGASLDINRTSDNQQIAVAEKLRDEALQRITSTAWDVLVELIIHRIEVASRGRSEVDYPAMQADVNAMEVQLRMLTQFAADVANARGAALERLWELFTNQATWL